MDKLKQESVDITEQNIDKIGALFPNVITEAKGEDGKLKKAINFDLLRQMLSKDIVEGDEAYEFTWVGKKQSIIDGNMPIRKTLRPCKEESKNWENTENLYIEGDNLEVLKLLQNSYLNSIKMIYIDPPYNTGNDFVYRDNFAVSQDDYDEEAGAFDEDENRLFKNPKSKGRYHSDWCSMIYPRLQLARNLLTEDGVIFISIDDNEVDNLRKICDEVFGEDNFIAQLIWERAFAPKNDAKFISNSHDYVLMLAKDISQFRIGRLPRTAEADARYSNLDNDPRGVWSSSDISVKTYTESCDYPITTPSGRVVEPPTGRCWRLSKNAFLERLEDNRIWFGADGNGVPRIKRFLSELKFEGMAPTSLMMHKDVGHSQDGAKEVTSILDAGVFDGPKPTRLLRRLLTLANTNKDSIILDFFSGSATTAHAVMQLNAEDGGSRRFICVQLPEQTDEKSEAYKAGYKNICEIGKERIRRAGAKIEEGLASKEGDKNLFSDNEQAKGLDTGFRVLKVDSTNMKDVYYGASEYNQQMLLDLEGNIKEDRTDIDLLFGVLLDWGVPLSVPMESKAIDGRQVYFVNDTDLVACFDDSVTEELIRELAKCKPMRVVFKDSSFASSADKINVTEIFKTISPETTIKVI